MRKTRTNLLKRLSKAAITCLMVATVLVINDVQVLATTPIEIGTGKTDGTSYSDGASGDVQVTVYDGGTITGGTYDTYPSVIVKLGGTIKNGYFHYVENSGTIENGTFNGVTNKSGGIIKNGTFAFHNDGLFVTNESGGKIENGLFKNLVVNSGDITGGTFERNETSGAQNGAINMLSGSTISNATVYSPVILLGGAIRSGTFYSNRIEVNRNAASYFSQNAGTIEGGTFNGCTIAAVDTSSASLSITGGIFYGGTIGGDNGETINITSGTFVGVAISDNVHIENAASDPSGSTLIFENCTFEDESVLDNVKYLPKRPVTVTATSSGGSTTSASSTEETASGVDVSAVAVSIESSFVGADGVTYRRLTAAGNPSIYVQGDESYLPVGGHFSYIPALDGTDVYTIASGIVASRFRNVSNFSVIDMNLSDASHNEIHELNGNVYVTMPIPAGLTTTGKTLIVYRVDGPNTLTRCNTTTDGTSLTFTTNHFSTYVVVEQDGITSPKTGER